MTGLSILKQAYSLMEQPQRLAQADGDENGLIAVNQIYGELWHREHRCRFQPLEDLRQRLELSWQFLPAMTYGTAMLLCLNGDGNYSRYQDQYQRAARVAGGVLPPRQQTAFPVDECL